MRQTCLPVASNYSRGMNAVTWITILTSITAILGVAFGIAGFVLGILNYRRDRPIIKIHLQWNMELLDDSFRQVGDCGVIRVTNTGRRPVFISHVCLLVPSGHKHNGLLFLDSVPGRKLSEGDPPAIFVIPHDVQKKCSSNLRRIRAQVEDSTGQVYISKYPKIQAARQQIEPK